MRYEILVVGSGLFGAVCARELTDKGFRCLVVEKRKHIGGNCYTELSNGINIHKYGPHIFHTSNHRIWNYINNFGIFNNFIYRPKVSFKGRVFSFPINLLTLYQIFGVTTPLEAFQKLESVKIQNNNPTNLEEWILSQVGQELYDIFIKGYSTKQWGKEPRKLPISIIKRIPIRLDFEDNYYFDNYQGIPIGGYSNVIKKILGNVDVLLDFEYSHRFCEKLKFRKIIYCGEIDKFYDFKFGKLEYRSLKFDSCFLENVESYQGTAAVNYTDVNIPYTRIIEHKYFEFSKLPHTIITKEYPSDRGEPYYPLNDRKNNVLYNRYLEHSKQFSNIYFGGRLGLYKYLNMDETINEAFILVEKIVSELQKPG